jgi:ABC-type branched-subunit amino acid transport system substrate-binding protein
VCGKHPWGTRGDLLQLVSAMLSRDPTPADTVAPAVGPKVSQILARTLKKEPKERFASMEEVLRELSSESDGLAPTESAARTGEDAALARPIRLPRALVAVGLAIAVIAVALGARFIVSPRRTASPAASASAPARACNIPVDCAREGGPPLSTCRADDGVCVPLISEDCSVLAEPEDLRDPATLWIGAMFPLRGSDGDDFGRSNLNAMDLARRDFAAAFKSLRHDRGARPIGIVACDDSADPSRAAAHLARDLRVPAVVGFATGTEAIELANSTFLPAGTLVVSSLNSTPLLARIPQPEGGPRLVFRTTYSTTVSARAIAALVGRFEPRVSSRRMKVVLVRRANAAGLGFSHEIVATLAFNGKSAVENGDDYREIVVDGLETGAGTLPNYDAVVAEVARFAPHVVLVEGYAIFDHVVLPLEKAWRKDRGYRPLYISPGLDLHFLRSVDAVPGLRARFFPVTATSNTLPNARFVVHYNEVFADKITRSVAPNTSYDTVYVLGYAAYALRGAPATGAALSRSIPRLLGPGRAVDVGPAEIYDALDLLRKNENIDLNGATGRLDFDLTTGDAPVDQAVLCVVTDAAGHTVGTESGLVYNATRGEFTGELRCP